MADQIVIIEKTSQAKDVRAAVGLATVTFSRPKAIYSTCSNRKMLCLRGSAGHESFCGTLISN